MFVQVIVIQGERIYREDPVYVLILGQLSPYCRVLTYRFETLNEGKDWSVVSTVLEDPGDGEKRCILIIYNISYIN